MSERWYKTRNNLKKYKDAINIGYYLRKKFGVNFKIQQSRETGKWELFTSKKV